MFRYIEPEVAGGLGNQTILDITVHPPKIEILNYEFSGWLGDDILESFPCYIMSERLKNKIDFENLSGIIFENVIITKSENFMELYPTIKLPKFYWAQINGRASLDDFIIGQDLRMIISDKALAVLKSFNLNYATFEEIEESF